MAFVAYAVFVLDSTALELPAPPNSLPHIGPAWDPGSFGCPWG